MDENVKKHLHDILDAINEIESFFGDKPKYFNEFCNDLCLRRAVERDIEIIGEAMNRILKEDRNISVTNSRKIVDARNYIIHGYDSLSADILWSIVINHLPKLKEQCERVCCICRSSTRPEYLSKAPRHRLQWETESTSSDNLCGVLR